MDNKSLYPSVRNLFTLCLILGILLLSQSIAAAGQVVITPDKTVSPVFHTSTATCYGTEANTHINLGFGTSVTGKVGTNHDFCTIGGGKNNTAAGFKSTIGGGEDNTAAGVNSTVGGGSNNSAYNYASTVAGGNWNTAGYESGPSGDGSTVGGGWNNRASGYNSTISGGEGNTAGGDHSWAGGMFMKLEDTADNTFVWGHSADTEQSIPTANAFLIFPAGTSGKVGIGTKSPNEPLEVAGNGRAFFGDGGGSSRTGLLIDGNESGSYARIEAYDYSTSIGMDLVLNSVGGGKVGIGTIDPQYALDVIGNIRATGSVYYGGTSGSANGTPYTKPDYVFEEGYQVLSTEQVAQHLEKEKSLPWITSVKKEKQENGNMVDMTRMSFETVETVENLQVQIIALSETNKKQQKTIDDQQRLFEAQQETINRLSAEMNELRTLMTN